MRNSKGVLAVLALTSWAVSAQQQEIDSVKTVDLNEVVISDTRFALKREQSGKTVIRIGPEQLAREQGKSVADVLNLYSGIEVNGARSNALSNRSVFVRGGNNRQVLVLIDGVQVSDPSNPNAEFDFRFLDLSQIETIEVMKGAASTLYGNAAATAVISITTKKAKQPGFSVSGQSSIATNQDQNQKDYALADFSNSVQLGYKGADWNATLAYSNQYTDGLSAAIGEESDLLNRNKFRAQIAFNPSQRWAFALSSYKDYVRGEFDNGFPIQDAFFEFSGRQWRNTLEAKHTYGQQQQGSIEARVTHASIDREFRSDFPSAFDSKTLTLDVFNKHEWTPQLYTLTGLNFIQLETVFGEETFDTSNTDPYFSLVYLGDQGLNIHAGTRLNIQSEYGTNFIYHFNPSYRIALGQGYLKFLGSLATSYIAPNLSQLFGPFGPNPELEAETNRTLEVGVEHLSKSGSRFSALFFNRQEGNRINFETIDPENFISQYQNSGVETAYRGLELEGEFPLCSFMDLLTNYTFVEQDGGLALRVPEHKFNAQLQWQINSKSNASLDFRYTGSRQDLDFSSFETVELDAYSLLNVYYSYRFSSHLRGFVQVENIANTDYVELTDFTTRGRNLRLGVVWNILP